MILLTSPLSLRFIMDDISSSNNESDEYKGGEFTGVGGLKS